MNQAKAVLFATCFVWTAASVGCGYSEEEMQVKRDRIDPVSYTHLTLPTILRV